MKNNLQTELYRAAATTFDELGFLFAMPESEEDNKDSRPEATASVEFRGPFSGTLAVTLCGNLLETLAANMLGEDDAPSMDQQLDALGEIANVICGNVLPSIGGVKEVFYLEAPRVTEREYEGDLSSPSALVSLPLGSGRADVTLHIMAA